MNNGRITELIVKHLKQFRAEAKMTQAEASDLSGVPIDNLRRYESGKSTPPIGPLRQLCEAYGHRVDDLFQETPPPADLDLRPPRRGWSGAILRTHLGRAAATLPSVVLLVTHVLTR